MKFKSKIVIALGGNALGNNLKEQMVAVKTTAKAIVDLIEDGHEVLIVHGNGPQVGVINNAMTDHAHYTNSDPTPLSVCVAMSQAYIGYDIQNAVHEEFLNRNLEVPPIATVVTQIRVDENDKAFEAPTKPIGKFMGRDEALEAAGTRGWVVKEDAGRGYRRVVASPAPKEIIELNAIRSMADDGQVVICCGGGGIPVISNGKHLAGVPAVIDKDAAAALLAKNVNADTLIILTAVEKVAIGFGTKNEKWLDTLTTKEALEYADSGEFAPGSMLPKVLAAVDFASSGKDKTAMITLLEKAKDAINGKTGTKIISQ